MAFITPEQRALVPRSNAKNAYDLMNDAIASIEAQPLRLYMGDWLIDEPYRYRYMARPECGVIACAAGWIAINRFGIDSLWPDAIQRKAREALVNPELFNKDYAVSYHMNEDLYTLFHTTTLESEQGTPEYVAEAVALLRDFQSTWETQLREYIYTA